MKDRHSLSPTPVPHKESIRITRPSKSAAGWKGIFQVAKHVWKEMNLGPALRVLNAVNQQQGIDCPGCAWPDPSNHRSRLGEYCENGGKALAEEATRKRVDPEFFKQYSVSELAQWSDYQLGKSGRLTHPMILHPGSDHYEPLPWKEAFETIAQQLNKLASPDEAIFYTSGRTSNEAAFLYQLFVRMFGTNNLPDCSNMCHESSGVALSETLGIGKGSVTLEDFYQTDLVLIIGQNPGTNHPRMLSALQKAKRAGAKIISVNPLPEVGLIHFRNPQEVNGLLGNGATLSDLFLQVKINEDIALLKAIIGVLWEQEQANPGTIFDHDFIREKTEGYESLLDEIKGYDVAKLAAQSGIEESLIRAAAELIISSEKMIVCWAMGLTQHQNAVNNIREVVNLLLLKGSIGKPGAGTCPVRGHSNVQGDRTMGIWEKPKEAFLDRLEDVFQFQAPRDHGYNTVEAIQAMIEGKAKVFFAMGGNFISATPDTHATAQGLQQCDLTVQVSTKLNRSHLICGKTAIILPCLGRTEKDVQARGPQFVTVENSMGVVHTSEGKLPPASPHLLSEPVIITRLAEATLGATAKTPWTQWNEDYDQIRDLIEEVIPGFEQYNERVREKDGFYLPNTARAGTFRPQSQKALFTVNPLPHHSLAEGEFLMMTIRSHDQFNTTIYGLDDRYRGVHNGRRVVFMNEEDIKNAGLSPDSYVDLSSHYHGVDRIAPQFKVVPYPIPRQCVATYFPEANPLVPLQEFADRSHTPVSKSIIIRIQSASEPVHG